MAKQKWSRSLNDGKAWRCRCGNVNQPTKHRFFKLPAFDCSQCHSKLKLNFKFCLGEVKTNGKSVIGDVWDQDKAPYCVAFAYGKTVEIMERAYNIRKGLDPDTVEPIDPYDLEQRFDDKFSNDNSDGSHRTKVGTHKVLHMGLILRSEGILRRGSMDRYIAADVSTIPRDDFEQICHCLAEGIPLLATYWVGKRRGIVGYCKRYKSPPEYRYAEKEAAHIGHAVVLIGAGMKKGKLSFFFLNSWGKKFCPRKNKRCETITGGIGKIQAEDLTKNVIRLSHPNESGGERRLEDQSGITISNVNLVLMKEKANQRSAQRLQKLREKEKSGKIQSVSLDDDGIISDYDSVFSDEDLDDDGIISDYDSVFSDDEGGYSHTSCSFYQGIIRAIRSLNSRPASIQKPTDRRCTTNGRSLMNQLPANERPQVNQTPAATLASQTPLATMVNQTPAATLVSQTPVANGRSLMRQIPASYRRPVMSQIPAANGRSPMNQIHVASGQPYTQEGEPELHLAPFLLDCPAKVADPKLKVEEEKMKALPQKLINLRSKVMPKQSEMPTTKQEPRCGILRRATRLLKWRL